MAEGFRVTYAEELEAAVADGVCDQDVAILLDIVVLMIKLYVAVRLIIFVLEIWVSIEKGEFASRYLDRGPW